MAPPLVQRCLGIAVGFDRGRLPRRPSSPGEGGPNGEPCQSAIVADLVFDISELIAMISAGSTLLPGDMIATGTPAGVGIGFDPPRFLAPGDVAEATITGLDV
jgi:hypothetical protein